MLILPANTAQERSGYTRYALLDAAYDAVEVFIAAAEICAGGIIILSVRHTIVKSSDII